MERLRAFARSHGVADSPADLGRLIGKKPNQVTNLLGGHSSFGEKVARSIEEAAGLPTGWLDEDERSSLSAEAAALARAIDAIPDPQARATALHLCHELVNLQAKLAAAQHDLAQERTQKAG